MMRTLVLAFLLIFLPAQWSRADYHIVQAATFRSKDENVDKATSATMQTLLQKVLPESHYWLSNDRSALVLKPGSAGESRTILVDLLRRTCTLLAGRRKRYVTTHLPFDPAAVLSEGALRQLPRDRVSMQVAANDLRRRIMGFRCRGYILTSGTPDDWVTRRTVWATQHLSLDPRSLETTLKVLGQASVGGLFAPRQYPEARGFPLLCELESPSLTLDVEAVTIEETPIPGELFAIPRDHTRVDRLEIDDIVGEHDTAVRQMLGLK